MGKIVVTQKHRHLHSGNVQLFNQSLSSVLMFRLAATLAPVLIIIIPINRSGLDDANRSGLNDANRWLYGDGWHFDNRGVNSTASEKNRAADR